MKVFKEGFVPSEKGRSTRGTIHPRDNPPEGQSTRGTIHPRDNPPKDNPPKLVELHMGSP